MSTFKLQNRIEDTGRAITGMVVTDDDNLLLCDYRYLSIFRRKRKACFSDPFSTINNISLRYNSTSSVASNTLEISTSSNVVFS
jgi:hypothetical protein